MKLRNTPITSLFANASLTVRFAVNSFICIGIMTSALWFMVSNYLINQIVEREWQTTAQIVRTDVRTFLEDYDFKAQDRKSVGHKFVALLEHMRLSPDIVRFKVYNPKGIVIWSDDKRLVGKSFIDNPQLQRALRGQVVADMSSLEKHENIFEPKSLSGAVEVYVPIYSESGRELLGVFETPIGAPIRYSMLSGRREQSFFLAPSAAGCFCMFRCLPSCGKPRERSTSSKRTC